MRAAVMRAGRLVVDEVDDPAPGPGQVLVRTLACGICGSDLHALQHSDRMTEMSRAGGGGGMDLSGDVVMGHEFSAEVVEPGSGVTNLVPGDVVVSVPVLIGGRGVGMIGYSSGHPGGYGELMVLSAALALKIPDGLDPRLAALTEPMAVGLHAVNRAEVSQRDGGVVLGCGPIGLASIAALAGKGVEPIVASDFSPRRRELASKLGAHEVVDPSAGDPVAVARRLDRVKPLVVIEAVGVPGMLDSAIRTAPSRSRIVVVGVCMEPDTVHPMVAVTKELDVRFSFGYSPQEFASTLGVISSGRIDVGPMITATVRIDDVPAAFEWLSRPDEHVKILVTPAEA